MLIYTVKQGDTLSALSKQYGVPVSVLVRDNQLKYPDRLVVGQALVIGAEEEGATIYIVQRGDNLTRIARRFNTTVQALLDANPEITNPDRIYVDQQLIIPNGESTGQTIYTVRRGDNLTRIARRFNTTVEALLEANPEIVNPDLIYTNQRLVIPARGKRSIRVNGYCYVNIDNTTLDATLPFLTYISPFSYEARRDGSISTLNDATVIEHARENMVAPLFVLTNIDQRTGNFNSDLASAILRNTRTQEQLLNNIVSVIQEKGLHGLDVDFEYVRASDKENYNAFLQRAVDKLHPLGYTVFAAVAAKARADQPGLLFEGVDYEAIGRIVDRVLLMTYNWGYRYGPPMAVAPLNLVEDVIRYAVTVIPSEKILLGIPNYAYDWILPYDRRRPAELTMNIEAVNRAVEHNSEIMFDSVAMCPYFHYNDDRGRRHVVWFDDARSMQAKYSLIEKYDLGGLSYWNINTLFLPSWLVLSDMYDIDKLR